MSVRVVECSMRRVVRRNVACGHRSALRDAGLVLMVIGCGALLLAGCVGSGLGGEGERVGAGVPVERLAQVPTHTRVPSGPIAVVGGETLSWDDLLPGLVEMGGAGALEEAALSAALKQECARLGIVVGQEELSVERSAFVRTLTLAGWADVHEHDAQRVLQEVRRRRGLGEYRFAGLLERGAMLRAIVRADPEEARLLVVSEDDHRTAYQIKYGERVRVRVVVVEDQASAARVRSRLESEAFERVAREESVDPSGQNGGLIESLSLADAGVPVAIRQALAGLDVGGVSRVVNMDGGGRSLLAIVKLEARLPARADAPRLEDIADELRNEVHSVRERAAMDRLAGEILRRAGVRVIDPKLGQAWDLR